MSALWQCSSLGIRKHQAVVDWAKHSPIKSQQKVSIMNLSHYTGGGLFVAVIFLSGVTHGQSESSQTNSVFAGVISANSSNQSVWRGEVGNGFAADTQSVTVSLGAGYGVRILGGKKNHDLALASVSYGYMLGPVQGEGHWYEGNWELRGEFFSGAQFSPSSEWLVGAAPHLRYNFATGTRWVPFVDAGAGVSATSIGPPDLSHYFEFNIQAGAGVRYFIRDNVALGAEARYLHLSCAGINSPNQGLNNVVGLAGVSWFF